MLRLSQTQVDEGDNCAGLNLGIQQLLIVKQKFLDCKLGHERVPFGGRHSLFKEQINPLGDIVLVDVVTFD